MMKAIEVTDLVKNFGPITALNGVSFSIEEGEVFGLLGPNGAGKTTLIRILTTLMRPTAGKAHVMGINVEKEKAAVRKLIGVVPQAMTSDLDLTGLENMDIYARFYDMPRKEREERIEYLLGMVGLKDFNKKIDDIDLNINGNHKIAGGMDYQIIIKIQVSPHKIRLFLIQKTYFF